MAPLHWITSPDWPSRPPRISRLEGYDPGTCPAGSLRTHGGVSRKSFRCPQTLIASPEGLRPTRCWTGTRRCRPTYPLVDAMTNVTTCSRRQIRNIPRLREEKLSLEAPSPKADPRRCTYPQGWLLTVRRGPFRWPRFGRRAYGLRLVTEERRHGQFVRTDRLSLDHRSLLALRMDTPMGSPTSRKHRLYRWHRPR